MGRVLSLMRSTVVRAGFVVVALGFGVFAVASRWSQVRAALTELSPGSAVLAVLTSLVFVLATMASWRAVLRDLGSALGWGTATTIFAVSQLGKYVPGGVWNFVAAAEMGADAAIPRRRSVSGMMVALLISVTTGLLLAGVGLLLGPREVSERFWWVALALPLLLVLLWPGVLNRVLDRLLRLVRRPPLERRLTLPGIGRAAGWAMLAWGLGGLQVWLIAVSVGLPRTPATLALAVAGYALAWTAGFLVVVVPAGLGVREAALALMLSTYLEPGPVLVVVLLSRIAMTAADVVLGVGGAVAARGRRRSARGLAEPEA